MKNLLKFGFYLACLVPVAAASAQGAAHYPSMPVKIVVPFAPGGGTDVIARVIAQSLSKRLGQPVIVDNRPGAGGSLGASLVANSKADGYTLLLGSNGPISINPSLYRKLSYSPTRDFVPVANIASVPFLIVAHPSLPANNIAELVKLARKTPGAITYASPGNGTTNHLVGAMIEAMAGVDMLHVPYKGAAAAANDVIGGQVDIMSGDANTLLPMVKSGKLKALAVTGSHRSDVLPNVPTVAESGLPQFDATGWFGLFAPRATPAAITAKLNREVNEVLKDEGVKQRIHALGGVVNGGTPEKFLEMTTDESRKWAKLISDRKIPVEQ
ncbi:Bug family tripartite tricarboxylate transporter substrate binding protein [Massilia niastensis]|uniref:Bug family tripartite tricarboxylate transporter substrate binding protein n=1 Tax=Massilia niastensis TaxID=544911 RepID=UPI0003785F33|nr:tripartite tricarboxylate transporter substrate binding protein [Massilia niastensis]